MDTLQLLCGNKKVNQKKLVLFLNPKTLIYFHIINIQRMRILILMKHYFFI